jgi:hypothetical protein
MEFPQAFGVFVNGGTFTMSGAALVNLNNPVCLYNASHFITIGAEEEEYEANLWENLQRMKTRYSNGRCNWRWADIRGGVRGLKSGE